MSDTGKVCPECERDLVKREVDKNVCPYCELSICDACKDRHTVTCEVYHEVESAS